MKKRLPTFIAGMLTMAIAASLTVGALAATGQLTITVDPVNIQVNGQTFQPKDAQGNDVPVFSYNGTTYAPLRALAEAYGLEVGYDAGANMATVGEKGSGAQPVEPAPTPDTTASAVDYSSWSAEEEAAYQEFRGKWEVTVSEETLISDPDYKSKEEVLAQIHYLVYIGTEDEDSQKGELSNMKNGQEFYRRMCTELNKSNLPVSIICFGLNEPSKFDFFGRAVLTPEQFYIIGYPTQK